MVIAINHANAVLKIAFRLLLSVTLALLQVTSTARSVLAQSGIREIPFDVKSLHQRVWENAGPIYTPAMPAAVFLDSAQAGVAKVKKPKIEDLIVFYEPGSDFKSDLVPTAYKLKTWTAEEKKDLNRIVGRLLEIAPTLLINAASGDKLIFGRTTSGIQFTAASEGNIREAAAAFAYPGAIVISDSFFLTPHQFHGLTHELVHEADLSGRFCYSKEWVEYINKDISRARIRFANSPMHSIGSIQRELTSKEIVPSPYACENVTEAFAEMTSSYIDGSFQPSAKFKTIAQPFLTVRPEDLKCDREYKRGASLKRRRESSGAVTILEQQIKETPQLPMVHGTLSSCYADLGRLDECRDQAHEALRLFAANGMPYTDPQMMFAARNEIYALGCRRERVRTLLLLDELLAHVPFDLESLYQKSWIEGIQKNPGDAIRDLYLNCYADDYATILRDADADPDLVSSLLDDGVKKFPALPLTLLRRAHFNEWRGDYCSDTDKQTAFYRKALDDYQSACKLDTSAFPECVFDCFNLEMKLGKRDDAEKLLEQETVKRPDATETKAMRIQNLAISDRVEEARKQFEDSRLSLRADIKMRGSRRPSNTSVLLPDQK